MHTKLGTFTARMVHELLLVAYGWLAIGLTVSGLVTQSALSIAELQQGWRALGIVAVYGALGFLFVCAYTRFSYRVLIVFYGLYAALTGVVMASVGGYYHIPFIPHCFFMAAATVGMIALCGMSCQFFFTSRPYYMILLGWLCGCAFIALYVFKTGDWACAKAMSIVATFLVAVIMYDQKRMVKLAMRLHEEGYIPMRLAMICAFRLYVDCGLLGITLLGMYDQGEKGDV